MNTTRTYQIFDDVQDARLSRLHAIFSSLDGDTFTGGAVTREADGDAAVLIGNLSQNLSSARHKVTVVFGVHVDLGFGDVFLQEEGENIEGEYHIVSY